MTQSRAGHRATLLPDGRVLIAGAHGDKSSEVCGAEARPVVPGPESGAARSGTRTAQPLANPGCERAAAVFFFHFDRGAFVRPPQHERDAATAYSQLVDAEPVEPTWNQACVENDAALESQHPYPKHRLQH